MLQNPLKYKLRPSRRNKEEEKKAPRVAIKTRIPNYITQNTILHSPISSKSPLPDWTEELESDINRGYTFSLEDLPEVVEDWDLDKINNCRDAIPPDPIELSEARLLCREAMTLITEEVAWNSESSFLLFTNGFNLSGLQTS